MHDFKKALVSIETAAPITVDSQDAIIFALRTMIKLQGEVSYIVQREGAVKLWDECKDGTIGYDQATNVFKAMLAETLKEVEQENGK